MPMPSLTFAVNIIQPFSPASSAPRQTSAPDSRNYRKISEKYPAKFALEFYYYNDINDLQ
jgi:hypothetical protein